MSKKLIILISICTMCLFGGMVQAAPFGNGDFETGVLSPWWGWGDGGSVTIVPTGGVGGSQGALITNFGGTYSTTLGQDIDWSAGASIDGKISLQYRADSWGGAGVAVKWFDSGWANIGWAWAQMYAGNGTDTGWQPFTASSAVPGSAGTWIAPAGTAYAEIRVEQWTWGEVYVDNVVLTPEPATMILLGIGGLVALRRKHA